MGKASDYGYVISVRRKAIDISKLLNEIVAKFGKSIEWHKRTGYHHIKPLEGRKLVYFRFRGSVYSKKLELLSYDIDLLRTIKTQFPLDFEMEVEIKEGWL